MPAAVHLHGFLQLSGKRLHGRAQEERVSADARADVQQNQAGLRADQAVRRRADALQHEELRDDAKESGQHQRKQIHAEQHLASEEVDARKPVGGQRRDHHRDARRHKRDDHAVERRPGQRGLRQDVFIRREADSRGHQMRRIGQHIAEFLERIAQHEPERQNKDYRADDQNHPERGLSQLLHSIRPPSVRKTRLSTTVVSSTSMAVIRPMAAPCPNSNRLNDRSYSRYCSTLVVPRGLPLVSIIT